MELFSPAKSCVCVEGTELLLLACDICDILCSRLWLDLGQVLDLWLDVLLICDDFLLHFIELCVPGNDKLCVAVGDSGIFSLS